CADLGMHLPSDAELTSIYTTTTKNSGIKSLLNMSGDYWSSSECDSYDAWRRYFPSGGHYNGTKVNAYYVRCVR
ncbi:MAG: DUF1566 domain-containing protein, partial [Candidatus Gastranaerophilales bacterium]|nr:DUF1566 domain-containing protein [Candidatus Gastranaerophilales bacterium]